MKEGDNLGLISWLIDKFGGKPVPTNFRFDEDEYASLVFDIYVREMAFWSAVNLVANAVSKCEFKHLNGKEVKAKSITSGTLSLTRIRTPAHFSTS